MFSKNFVRTLILTFLFKMVNTDHFTSMEKLKKMILTHEQATVILSSAIEIQTLKIEKSLK